MFKRNVLAVSMTLAALCSAQAAMADVNGGGATLPQPLYQTAGVLTAGFAPYIGVGSGNGKAAFLNNDYSKLDATVTGKNVHWAGSDSKLSSTELSNYVSAHGSAWGPLIQVPSVATSVAIPFNKAGVAGKTVNLSVNDLCGVFSGRLTLGPDPGLRPYRPDHRDLSQRKQRHHRAVHALPERQVQPGPGRRHLCRDSGLRQQLLRRLAGRRT